jgi:glycosyltransferase involved in cell wall biosynthesis
MKKLLIVIPAYNEEAFLERNMIKLHEYLIKNVKNYKWTVIIADHPSRDNTSKIAEQLSKKLTNFNYIHLPPLPRGKSRAIKKVWTEEDADYYLYMDADLSTDIKHTTELIHGLEEGYDLVIGSRTKTDSEAARKLNRKIISKSLIWILQLVFGIKVSDFQCGFKAVNKKVIENILPKMRALDVGFMDTEMIVVAHQKRYSIKEIPVFWEDYRKGSAPVIKGIFDGLYNILKIKMDLILGRYR